MIHSSRRGVILLRTHLRHWMWYLRRVLRSVWIALLRRRTATLIQGSYFPLVLVRMDLILKLLAIIRCLWRVFGRHWHFTYSINLTIGTFEPYGWLEMDTSLRVLRCVYGAVKDCRRIMDDPAPEKMCHMVSTFLRVGSWSSARFVRLSLISLWFFQFEVPTHSRIKFEALLAGGNPQKACEASWTCWRTRARYLRDSFAPIGNGLLAGLRYSLRHLCAKASLWQSVNRGYQSLTSRNQVRWKIRLRTSRIWIRETWW